MARLETFDRDIQIATAGLSLEAISGQLAAFAKSELARVIQSGEASSVYDRFVNGVKDAPEATVVPPGPILYEFGNIGAIVVFALDYLQRRSPIKSEDYQKGHFAAVDNVIITDPSRLAGNEIVTISNVEPYSRKIEVGHMRMTVEPGVYQDARQAVARQFPSFTVQFKMITRPGGYVLKGKFHRGFRPKARQSLKKDTAAGQPVTYPALVIEAKT